MPDVTCVGIAVLDRVFKVDEHPTTPGKYRASERAVVGGGVAANAAVTVARLGGRARFCGVVGNDEAGHSIIAGLEEEGVETGAIVAKPDRQSPESLVLVDRFGERLIVNHASTDLFDTAPPHPRHFTGSAAVLVDMRWSAGAVAALEAARRLEIPGIVDCDHDPADSPGVLDAASHVVFASDTLRRWTGMTDLGAALAEAKQRTGAWVAATQGARGTTWLEAGQIHRQPAFDVEVVDTLGAGDVFHGAFALALAEGREIPEALRWASAAAAVKCRRFGGRAGIPTRSEVDEFLEER